MDYSKSVQLNFRDTISLFTILLNKNKFILNYLLENLNISDDLLMLQELKTLLSISVHKTLMSTTNIPNFQDIDDYDISSYKFNILYNEKFFNFVKLLYCMFNIQYNISELNADLFISLKKKHNILNLDYKLCNRNSNTLVNCQKLDDVKLSFFYQYYFQFMNDYKYLENVNVNLASKINELEIKLNYINCNTAICGICPKLKESLQTMTEKYNSITQKCSAFQTEKERMVMKYATSEKHVIEAQRFAKLTEKKYHDALKETAILQKKIQKAHDSIVKLTSEVNLKSSEIVQLRIDNERYKSNDNLKDLQLKCSQNKLKNITDTHKETQIKLNESLTKNSELTNECELLKSQIKNLLIKAQHFEENKVTILDQQLKEQQARLILERHIAEDSESSRVKLQKEFDLLLDRQRFSDNENSLLITQIRNLEKECVDYKSKCNILNTSFQKANTEIQTLKNEVAQMEIINKCIPSKEQKICAIEAELQRLYIEKQEFLSDIEAYRQREIHMLDFTQKLTDKNVQLQCEFTNMQNKIRFLENNQKPLNKAINKFVSEVKNLEYTLSCEEIKRIQECEILSKYIAEQAFYNEKLFYRLEDLEGENVILRKRYDLTIREMTRELNLYHTKVKNANFLNSNSSLENNIDNSQNLNTENINIPLMLEKRDVKYKIYKSILEKEQLLNQIIKLQKVNVKRAEKLDFLEEHSHALLQELQKKTKIIQDYNLQNNKLINNEKF